MSNRDRLAGAGAPAHDGKWLPMLALAVLLSAAIVFVWRPGPRPEAVPLTRTAERYTFQPVHATKYQETGRGGPKTWELYVPYKSVLIAGGPQVDGQDGGVLRAYSGDRQITLTVTNGFYLIVPREYAEEEWCRLLERAEQLDWACGTQEPLEGWSCE